jgi:Ca2+-binding RTX toxin-like protein
MTGLFGVLQLNVVTGDYTYTETVPTTANQTEVFSYTIRDADGDTSSATLSIAVQDRVAARVLEGVLLTNSNQTSQFITLSFAETGSADFRDNLHVAAKIYDLNLQGQQGSIIQDVGFAIDGDANYNVVLEASSGTKAQITAFSLEGDTIQGSGNAALEINNTSATNSDSTAITAIINPSDPPPAIVVQAKTVSTDGDATAQTLTDVASNTLNYYFGADGNDTLNGSSDNDVLNGGGGRDTINGGPATT